MPPMSAALRSVNPATGETIREYEQPDDREVAKLLQGAQRAFDEWRLIGFAERASLMRRAAARLRERQRDDAVLMAAEMGKPVAQGRAEVEKCAWVCDWFAEHAERLLAPGGGRDRGLAQLRGLRSAGRRARGDALELPVLAGGPLRRPRLHGRQRGPAEARGQRLRLRPGRGGRLPRGRIPGRRSSRRRSWTPGGWPPSWPRPRCARSPSPGARAPAARWRPGRASS